MFVVHFPAENRWLKNGSNDFVVPLPRRPAGAPGPEEALTAWCPGEEFVRQTIPLDTGDCLAVAVSATPEVVKVGLAADAALPLELQWGIAWRFRHEWQLPPDKYWPAGSRPLTSRLCAAPSRNATAWLTWN